ncbi:hypothetical protein ACFY93_28450 [Streptomyces sp. NPDC008313]|uniref:hypothetical protein n=1 Tax=Streptomyces sp. NPDC008313 TaxID=3364826 RepID=UPI0036EB850E
MAFTLSSAFLLTGCGSDHADAQQRGTDQSEIQPIETGSPASPSAATPDPPASSGTSGEREAQAAAAEAERERREAAPPGEVITPSRVAGASEEDFGASVARKGDLTVYTPTAHGDTLTIPVKVTNSGSRRAFYRFTIRITGPNGFDRTAGASMEVVGLYPGTSWPTELTVQDANHTPPKHLHITVEKLERTEHVR